MATGDELNQTLEASASTYTLTVQGRAAGGQTPEVLASVVVGKKKAAAAAAVRSGLTTVDATATLNSTNYIGTNNLDIGNSIHVTLSCRFSVASQSATVFLVLFDENDGIIGITRDFTLQADATYKDGAGKFLAPIEIVDTACAAQVYPILRAAPTAGTVDIFIEAI